MQSDRFIKNNENYYYTPAKKGIHQAYSSPETKYHQMMLLDAVFGKEQTQITTTAMDLGHSVFKLRVPIHRTQTTFISLPISCDSIVRLVLFNRLEFLEDKGLFLAHKGSLYLSNPSFEYVDDPRLEFKDDLTSIKLGENNELLFVGSSDGTARIYDTRRLLIGKPAELRRLQYSSQSHCVISPQFKMIGSQHVVISACGNSGYITDIRDRRTYVAEVIAANTNSLVTKLMVGATQILMAQDSNTMCIFDIRNLTNRPKKLKFNNTKENHDIPLTFDSSDSDLSFVLVNKRKDNKPGISMLQLNLDEPKMRQFRMNEPVINIKHYGNELCFFSCLSREHQVIPKKFAIKDGKYQFIEAKFPNKDDDTSEGATLAWNLEVGRYGFLARFANGINGAEALKVIGLPDN